MPYVRPFSLEALGPSLQVIRSDLFPCGVALTPDEEVLREEEALADQRCLEAAFDELAKLDHRHRRIVERRFGLNGHPELTYEAIGRSEGVSRQRAKQLLDDALSRIRVSLGTRRPS